jgi:hypothetical protein
MSSGASWCPECGRWFVPAELAAHRQTHGRAYDAYIDETYSGSEVVGVDDE